MDPVKGLTLERSHMKKLPKNKTALVRFLAENLFQAQPRRLLIVLLGLLHVALHFRKPLLRRQDLPGQGPRKGILYV